MLNFKMIFFTLIMKIGVIMSLSSNNWISIWLGLEISLISFIPIMHLKSKINSESCFKYYIIQSMSSLTLLVGMIMNSLNMKFNLIMLVSLMIKLGMAPFHIWILSIMEGMSYYSMFMLFSIMKLAPLNLMFYLYENLQMIIWLNLMLSSVSAVSQNSMKKILCYSSIFNMSVCLSSIMELSIWTSFFLMYIISNMMLMTMVSIFNFNFMNQIIILNNNFFSKFTLWMMLMSMGGMPPTIMFLAKLTIMENLIIKNDYFTLIIMIISSLITMFMYIRMSMLSMLTFSLTPKWSIQMINYLNFIIMLMFIILPIIFSFKTLS